IVCRQAVKVIGETRDPRLALRRDGIESTLKYLSSDYRDCCVAATHAMELGQETGDVFLFALYSAIASSALLHLGQWRLMQGGAVAGLAKACLGLRDYQAAWAQLNAVVQKTEVEGNDMDSLFYPYFCNSLCEYFLETGDLAQAQKRALQLYAF